jgi:hypothetical protein
MHLVDLTADSLYEAVARGMKALQNKEWSGPGAFQISYVDVTVTEPEVTHRISLKKFNEWLERSHGSPREVIQRQRLRAILHG